MKQIVYNTKENRDRLADLGYRLKLDPNGTYEYLTIGMFGYNDIRCFPHTDWVKPSWSYLKLVDIDEILKYEPNKS